jgi:hypothetical protein
MKFRQIGLPGTIAVLLTLVFLGSQPASSQAPQGRAGHTIPALEGAAQALPAQSDFSPYGAGNFVFRSSDPELEKLHAQEAQVESEVHSLLAQYGQTEKEGDRSAIKKKLSASLEKQFDLQQKRRDLEVARIEAQLKKLRELIKKRSDSRQTIIDKRLDQVLQEAEGLGWTSPHGFSYNGRSELYGLPTFTTGGARP